MTQLFTLILLPMPQTISIQKADEEMPTRYSAYLLCPLLYLLLPHATNFLTHALGNSIFLSMPATQSSACQTSSCTRTSICEVGSHILQCLHTFQNSECWLLQLGLNHDLLCSLQPIWAFTLCIPKDLWSQEQLPCISELMKKERVHHHATQLQLCVLCLVAPGSEEL